MNKKYRLSVAGIIICILAVVITIFTNRNNTGFENIVPQPTSSLPIIKIKSQGVLVDNAAANDGQSINIGSTIKTDATGMAEVDFPSGSVTRVAQDSEIVLQSFDASSGNTSVKINIGKIWSRVAKVLGKEDFQTESNNLIASVRGTSYGHELSLDGKDIVTVAKSTVECDCKVNKPWQAYIPAGSVANYDCTKNTQPKIFELTSSQMNDPWYLYNKDEDAKLDDAWPTPTPPSLKPSPKPTVKPTQSPTPTAQPTLTPSPTPVPLTIGTISVECYPTSQIGTSCGDRHTKFKIPGTGFDTSINANIVIYAIDANGKQYTADSASTGYTTITSNLIVAHFSNYLQGIYSIKIIQNGQTAVSPNSVLVQ